MIPGEDGADALDQSPEGRGAMEGRGGEEGKETTDETPPVCWVWSIEVLLHEPAAVHGKGMAVSLGVKSVAGRAPVGKASLGLHDELRLPMDPVGQVQVFEHRVAREILIEPMLVEEGTPIRRGASAQPFRLPEAVPVARRRMLRARGVSGRQYVPGPGVTQEK